MLVAQETKDPVPHPRETLALASCSHPLHSSGHYFTNFTLSLLTLMSPSIWRCLLGPTFPVLSKYQLPHLSSVSLQLLTYLSWFYLTGISAVITFTFSSLFHSSSPSSLSFCHSLFVEMFPLRCMVASWHQLRSLAPSSRHFEFLLYGMDHPSSFGTVSVITWDLFDILCSLGSLFSFSSHFPQHFHPVGEILVPLTSLRCGVHSFFRPILLSLICFLVKFTLTVVPRTYICCLIKLSPS